MFVRYIVRRRLASLLRPWMLEEPQIEVKLGLINSQVTVTNLSFDVTALDNLIDDPSIFSFKEVIVDSLTVRFSNWSFPAFKIEVHGVKVVLSAGEEDGKDERLRRTRKSREEAIIEERKKALARIDPQGTALHDLLETLMNYNPSASGLTTSLLNLALNHCHFQIFNVVLEVQVPISNNTVLFSLELKKLNAESEFVENQCLLKGIIGLVYKPLKETSLMVEFTSFRVGYKLKDEINCVVPPTDVFTCFRWNDLNLVHCMIRVTELNLLFSVSDLSVLLVVAELLTKKSRCVRNGKQLWKLAATKLRFVISSPRLTLQNLVKCVCLWLCYLNAYHRLLSLLEYSEDNLFRRYANNMSRNRMFMSLVKTNWEVISSAEAELPAEAIVQARRIARFRVGLNSNLVRDGKTESSANIFTRILLVLSFIRSVMHRLLSSIGCALYGIKLLFQQSEVGEHADIDLGNKHTQFFILNFGKVVVSFSPSVLTQNLNNKQYSNAGFSNSDIQSFCLSIYGLLIVYTDKVSRKSLSISCGGLNVKPSSLNATGLDGNSNSGFSSVKRQQKGIDNNSKDVLWSEPALIILPSQAGEISIAGNPLLKKTLGEMYLSWKKAFFYYDDNEIIYSETPWFLSEISNCLSYSKPASPKNGLWKCSLAVGKLNICLGIASMISLSMLLGQLNHTLKMAKVNARENDSPLLSPTIEDQKGITLEAIFELCVNRIKMALLDLFPDRWIRLGIFVTGPQFQISLRKIGVNVNNQIDFTLGCRLHDIEVVVWPTSKSEWAAIEWPVGSDKIVLPQIIEISRPKSEMVASQWWIALGLYLRAKGLSLYVEESGGQQSHVCILKPIVFQSLIFRESVDIFGASATTFSASYSVIADGLTVVLNMDELYTFIQVVSGSLEAVLYAFASTHLFSLVPLQDIVGGTLGTRESGDERSMADLGDSINKSALFSIRGNAKFKSVDLIVQSCKLNDKLEDCIKGSKSYDVMIGKGLDRCDLTNCGIWFSVHQIYIEKACEEEKLKVFFELSKIHAVICRCLYYERDLSIVTDLMLKPNNWLCEFSLINFSHSILFGWTRNVLNDMSSGSTLDASIVPPTSHWMLMNFTVGGVFMASCPVKDLLIQTHQLDKLTSMLSVAGGPLMFDLRLQGIHLFLETTALTRFSQCFTSLLHSFRNLLSFIRSSCQKVANAETVSVENQKTSHQLKWRLPEAFTMDLSQCSFVLVSNEESGGFRKISVEVIVHVKFQMTSMPRKFVLDLSRMSIFSQVLKEHGEINTEDPLSSVVASEVSLGHSAFASQHANKSRLGLQNHILYHLAAFIEAEQPMNASGTLNQVWVGSGSITGFDVTVSLSEMQMIIHVVSSFSVPFTEDMDRDQKHVHWSNGQENDRSLEKLLPDGAIVALQDVDQHMYFSVEGEEKYSLVGVVHYSLCGERALFRVKHQQQRFWRSSIKVFSLISLYAKNNSGESLRLNYHPRSSIVDITSTVDDKWSLWSALACEHEYCKGDIDWEPCNKLVKDNFYLINQKNDCGVAFLDGIPEFVRKPGNLFKFKVFLGTAVPHSITTSDGCPMETGGARQRCITPDRDGQTSEQCGSVPFLQIKVDNISLTITHELLDSRNRVPLLRSCIDNTVLNIQILPLKTRVMSTSTASVYYFDAQRMLWREFLKPVAIFTFYRSNLQNQGTRTVSHGVPVHLHCRTEKLDTSLTEVSLDILLFMMGKLNLAGPFSVKSSVILANCCKVENQTGLNLLCTFEEKETVMIPRKQSTSVVLRNPVNQPSRHASTVTIQLTDDKTFATSSVQCSLSKIQTCAWRTRIMSLQGSSTHPGPFVVIDISRNAEEGLSITVSPLTAIHNETKFPLELRLQRLQQDEVVSACVLLKKGDALDDSKAAFDAISLSGGIKKALISLSLGNFMFSFRPEITDGMINTKEEFVVEWSDELKGGKAVRLSGVLDKLGYKVRRALSVDSKNCFFSTTSCILKSGDTCISKLHFLIQTVGREVPIRQPEKPSDHSATQNLTVAMQVQKGIFLLPTVQVSNLLHTEIHVLLSETDQCPSVSSDTIGKQATISCGSNAVFYANPSIIYFIITLTACGSRCKPVNSGDWIKKLQKSKSDFRCLDIPVEFGGGQYFASLRLSRGIRGIIEAVIYTSYSLRNDTGFSLFSYAPHQKPLSRGEVLKYGSKVPPQLGLYSPPKSVESWFSKSHKVRLKLLDDHSSEASLDLDALSGFTEISLEVQNRVGAEHIIKFGVSLGSSLSEVVVPSQIITLVPRHIIFNESGESVAVRQCYLEDESAHVVNINAKQKMALQLRKTTRNHREMSLFENFIRKHKNEIDSSQIHIQFRLNGSESSWSGPVCIASLGRFFIKFKKQASQVLELNRSIIEFAAVHVAEEGSSLVVHYHKPPNISLPYRIENNLCDASLTFYQKDSSEQEVLGPGCNTYYVWDDWTLPHKLVVVVDGKHLLREINLDKVRSWKPFTNVTQYRKLAANPVLDERSRHQNTSFGRLNSMELVKLGYEIYADGLTRVLRICEISDGNKRDRLLSLAKVQIRLSHFAIHLLELGEQDVDENDCRAIIVARFGKICLDSISTGQQKYNNMSIQSLNVDQRQIGAPFAAVIRRHESDLNDSNAATLRIVFVLLSTSSIVRQAKYTSIVLQPIDLNLDEETLMKIASFWRTNLSESTAPSQQYYFDHFEVHPIKIVANFVPGDSISYNSTQEALRSLLHSVVKIPHIKNMVVELNGVLVTHALITIRELFIRCAQHYSWYAMRAIYIAKGSSLLPPAFASIFDDLASSSLDVFFDPSRQMFNLPGLTLGTFKLITKCIDSKGFSGTKRYFGDLEKTVRTIGSNMLFAAVTEISDSILRGAETSGFDGLVSGFHQGILNLAMEPSVLGTALMGGGPDRRIKLDRSPGVEELYIEGYLQAMLDSTYKQEYLRVRVIDDQVILKNLPPNSALIDEILNRVKGFLVSKGLLKGDPSKSSRGWHHLGRGSDWKLGPTVVTLCEHLFVSFVIRTLRKQTGKLVANIKQKEGETGDEKAMVAVGDSDSGKEENQWFRGRWAIGKFVLSGMLAYIDGRLCRRIPNPLARRIVSGYLLSFLDKNDSNSP